MTPTRHRRFAAPALALGVLLAAAPVARAETIAATYTVQAAGLTVMEVTATLDITDRGYTIESRTRMRGVASAFASGQMTTRVEGVWEGNLARPRRYVAEGVWRGENRRTVVEWPNNQPVIRTMIPPNDQERQPVPEADQRNTIDNLSAIAQLIRQVRRYGSCNGAVRVYDGRRLSEMAARSQGRDQFPAARDEWSGIATKCAFEGRFLAGYRKDEDVEAARRPQFGTAWLGEAAPGEPVLPVRIEAASRWFGTITARLASVGPPGQLRPVSGR
ncbi:DUF3108 domain-containing protein [Roseomonas sp. WA12]